MASGREPELYIGRKSRNIDHLSGSNTERLEHSSTRTTRSIPHYTTLSRRASFQDAVAGVISKIEGMVLALARGVQQQSILMSGTSTVY